MIEEISRLKKERNAVILAHFYQKPEIQDIADFVGDSLELARKALEQTADVVVFCGVLFMAESAKILNPAKTVLLPVASAGCPMADMAAREDILKLRKAHPGAAVVTYVNSSADVKAVSDICCTSSNAVRVVQSLPEREIIFAPDRNLGRYVAGFCPDKQFYFAEGYCPVHDRITVADVEKARDAHPGAPVLVHPECRPEVVAIADFTGSTAQILQYVQDSGSGEFIIGTEQGILHRMRQIAPDKQFHILGESLVCPDMKLGGLEDVLRALRELETRIELDVETIKQASGSLYRMLAV
jgi:quinolinate synthase